MNVKLKEPVITMSLSQYEELREKANAADVKAGVIKQAVMMVFMAEFRDLLRVAIGLDDICRQRASECADSVLKRLHMD